MGCLGVHFALTADEVKKLKSFSNEKDRIHHLQNVIEVDYFSNCSDYLAENDKSWDAMHRCLSGGELTGGYFPLNHAVLGGELLYRGSDYIMSLKTPEQVIEISKALATINEADFRQRYFAINEQSYGCPLSEHDFGYTWEYFQSVRTLYDRAAKEQRFVLFTLANEIANSSVGTLRLFHPSTPSTLPQYDNPSRTIMVLGRF